MLNTDGAESDQTATELLLYIDDARPVTARDFARLLNAMASDYRKMMSHDLVISRVQEGSILTYFTEPRNFADAADNLLEFGKNIASLLAEVMVGNITGNFVGSGREIGSRTVHDVIKLADFSRCTVELHLCRGNSDETLLTVTHADAKRAMKAIRASRKRKPNTSKPVVESDYRGVLRDAASRSDQASRGIIVLLGQILKKNGLKDLIAQLADEIAAEGYGDAAKLLRGA